MNVGIVGATGLVGRTILQLLAERDFPVDNLSLFASQRSAGSEIDFKGNRLHVQAASEESLKGAFDVVFFSAGATVSQWLAPFAAQHARLVIDNSSAFRLENGIPLVVPEVNGEELGGYTGIVANPNCSTIQMVVALKPLHDAFRLEHVVVATYQSVSGTGAKGIRALNYELEHHDLAPQSPYPHRVAHNALPQIDTFHQDGFTGEERKMIFETRKILGLEGLQLVPTAVRVPVRVGHSEAIYARFGRAVDVKSVRSVLVNSPGVHLQDCPDSLVYPMAIEAEGSDDVFVGRIRQLPDDPRGISLWVVADNLRKGAATNAVQIAERALRNEK